MKTHYYLSIFPLEALIASQLEPQQFGYYMSMGKKNGSYERMMFIELEEEFGSYFDWEYARQRCVPHEDGSPKHSVWLSVYRALEHVDLGKLGNLHLTTKDGRTLILPPGRYQPDSEAKKYYVFQELSPLTPLVVSRLNPADFCAFLTDPTNKVHVPTVVFTDLKVVDFESYDKTGNIGGIYDKNLEHLRECIADIMTQKGKPSKNVERSVDSFSYQIINEGVYVGHGSEMVMYKMPTLDEIRQQHYEWGRSSMIL